MPCLKTYLFSEQYALISEELRLEFKVYYKKKKKLNKHIDLDLKERKKNLNNHIDKKELIY